MTRRDVSTGLAGLLTVLTLTAGSVRAQGEGGHWAQWRGPQGTGSAMAGQPPLTWSETEHVRWKVPIPGSGSSSPVVWGDLVFVTTATESGQGGGSTGNIFTRAKRWIMGGTATSDALEFRLLALARADGRVVWDEVAVVSHPHEGRHKSGSWASASAVADADLVCAFFGSPGLFCYDHGGERLWERDLGDMEIRMQFGEGASPALHGETLVVTWDHQGASFIVALDKWTGEERWRTPRDEITSWSTPLVVEHDGRAQVVTSATTRVRSYDLETGRLLWEGEGVTLNAIPSPVAADGLVFLTSGYRGSRVVAVRLDRAQGDITGTDAIAWSFDRDTPYVPSPVLHDGILYLVKSNNGIISAFDAATGTRLYGPERLPEVRSIYASPVAVGDRIYLPGRDGRTAVLRAGPAFEVLAINRLEDGFDASPALVGDELYLRGREFLYCIAPL